MGKYLYKSLIIALLLTVAPVKASSGKGPVNKNELTNQSYQRDKFYFLVLGFVRGSNPSWGFAPNPLPKEFTTDWTVKELKEYLIENLELYHKKPGKIDAREELSKLRNTSYQDVELSMNFPLRLTKSDKKERIPKEMADEEATIKDYINSFGLDKKPRIQILVRILNTYTVCLFTSDPNGQYSTASYIRGLKDKRSIGSIIEEFGLLGFCNELIHLYRDGDGNMVQKKVPSGSRLRDIVTSEERKEGKISFLFSKKPEENPLADGAKILAALVVMGAALALTLDAASSIENWMDKGTQKRRKRLAKRSQKSYSGSARL